MEKIRITFVHIVIFFLTLGLGSIFYTKHYQHSGSSNEWFSFEKLEFNPMDANQNRSNNDVSFKGEDLVVQSDKNNMTQSVKSQLKHVYVQLSGAVNRPGVYVVNKDTRLIDLVMNQGKGYKKTADFDKINLSEKVGSDGRHIRIPSKTLVIPSRISRDKKKENFPISISQASVDDLIKIPGIGPVLARRIVDYRSKLGNYTSLDQLKSVKGIHKNKFKKIKAYVTL